MEGDEIRTCAERDCQSGGEFTLTASEREWFENKGMALPKRCKECRARLRAKKEAEQGY